VPPSARAFAGLRQGLQDQGYLEGRNLSIEYRYAEGRADRFPTLAAELAGSNVDVIVTESTPAALAAKDATQTISIVMTTSSDPVKSGLAASFARPGGNVTGLTLLVPELSQKRLQLLKEVAPKATRVAVLLDSTNPLSTRALEETEAAAQSLGLQLQPIVVRSPTALDAVFKSVTSARPHVLITIGGGMLLDSRIRIVEFAAKSRLPAMFPDREFPEAGGLMPYGPDLAANFRRAAAFVHKILEGSKPADLPIEQPTKLEWVVNLKTAKELRLTIPQSVLGRADQVIE
jgi:putative tryptophan/tyrosine transport system substrate-binding protein